MKIGLIDADLMWQKHATGRRYGKGKADIFPNLAKMTRKKTPIEQPKQRCKDDTWCDTCAAFYISDI